jgi:hypothetical protein
MAKSGAGTGAEATALPLALLGTANPKMARVFYFQCGTGAVANHSQRG